MTEDIGIINTIITTLGAPGMIIICMAAPTLVMAFMYADHRRYERDDSRRMLMHQQEMTTIKDLHSQMVAAQERRFDAVVRNYENNVCLVENYQKLANELAGIIHMSTQVLTKLVEKIDNNHFCPIIKKGGPHGV